MPQLAAGPRIEPPVSEPSAPAQARPPRPRRSRSWSRPAPAPRSRGCGRSETAPRGWGSPRRTRACSACPAAPRQPRPAVGPRRRSRRARGPPHPGAAGHLHTGHGHQILDGDRYAVQRPAPLAARQRRVRSTGLLERPLGGDGDVRLEHAVVSLDAPQVRLGHLHRGEGADAQPLTMSFRSSRRSVGQRSWRSSAFPHGRLLDEGRLILRLDRCASEGIAVGQVVLREDEQLVALALGDVEVGGGSSASKRRRDSVASTVASGSRWDRAPPG